MTRSRRVCQPAAAAEQGLALLAVLLALMLLLLLALPFGVSMSAGADAAQREVEAMRSKQLAASVRDLLLADAALSHPAFDETPGYDGLEEFPANVEVPAAMDALRDQGRVLLGGSVEDLQRYFALDSISPLVLCNLLGTAVRLTEELPPDAAAITVDNAEALPDSGLLWVQNEVLRYGQKQGNRLLDCQRSLLGDQGFLKQEATLAEGALLLDFRCVMAAAWPFVGRSGTRSDRRPYADVHELAELAQAGVGTFSASELDRIAGAVSCDAMATTAATWGTPCRVYDALTGGLSRSLRVSSTLHLGPGSTVRLRDLEKGTVEYSIVMGVQNERAARDLLAPSLFRLDLLFPVQASFPAGDTLVEPLVPSPININTASDTVLRAIFEDVRRAADVVVHESDNRQRPTPPKPVTASEARSLAEEILLARDPANGKGALQGWQDFCERILKPHIEASADNEEKQRWIYIYRNLRTGRDGVIEMGTAPIAFASGPWVRIRAGDSLQRSTVAPGIAARTEIACTAAAVPGFRFEQAWTTQEHYEDAFVLDRRAPYWSTTPINLGALQPGDLGNNPSGRFFAHLVPIAFGDLGLGAPRFPTNDTVDVSVTPMPAVAPYGNWVGAIHAGERFTQTNSPRGWDLAKEGVYPITNIGPRRDGDTPQPPRRHDRISFPFSAGNGAMQPISAQFWLEPKSLDGVTIFDHGIGDDEHNRVSLRGHDGNLVLEVLDEAGLDPDPSQSPAGVERTATAIELPLAELGLPGNTPVHLDLSIHTGKPGEQELHVDGMPRGKAKFTTWLTSAIDQFDPTLNSYTPGQSPSSSDKRFLDIQVEDTEGFPPQGTLVIGLELFEYTSKTATSFSCTWKDSHGGRGARQVAREHRPDIPTGPDGKPTVDITELQQQGVNLDVFPEHPAGSRVSLYGYAARLAPDSPMMVGTTSLAGAVGGWAVARGFLTSSLRPIQLQVQGQPSILIGRGIDETWTGDLELADPQAPVAPDRTYPPPNAQDTIANAFPTGGGYALLLQRRWQFTLNQLGTLSTSEPAGGIEVVKYTSRQGNKLTGVQRAQVIPGNDQTINTDYYDGTARKFVMDYQDWLWDPNVQQVYWDNIPSNTLWVIPISLPVRSTQNLWDPQTTGLSEWVQLYPQGNAVDTEWVRYDAIMGTQHLCRGNRSAWDRLYHELVRVNGVTNVQVGGLGPTSTPTGASTPPWGSVTASSGFIGYTPAIESEFPQIYRARAALRFRGDMMNDFWGEGLCRTSSHPQSNTTVMQCQRIELLAGNYGAMTGRPGRHDRIALIDGSESSGDKRPTTEWHTVNWSARRFNTDNSNGNQAPAERLGPFPFQLVAFTDGVRGMFQGPPIDDNVIRDTRSYDRMVKFPSGELPAAFCENVSIGAAVGNGEAVSGFVDEIEVFQHPLRNCVVDEAFDASAKTFRVNTAFHYNPAGAEWSGTDVTQGYPTTGGLVAIDGEIIAFAQVQAGEFTVAQNGRGLLDTEARSHDRGAHVLFLTDRPAAILAGAVANRDNVLPVAALGALPRAGTVLMGRELLHYTWQRVNGGGQLEMPRWYPPGEQGTASLAKGLFRGRFGTAPASATSGEAVIAWPFRYWDRYAEQSDDPELAYFQLTTTTAPTFFRSIGWKQEVQDSNVEILAQARTDSRAPWSSDPEHTAGFWQFHREGEEDRPHVLATQASRFEIRFLTRYKAGAIDLVTGRAHAWKTTGVVRDVRLDQEGESRIFDERVTAR